VTAPNRFEALASHDAIVFAHGALVSIATGLFNDGRVQALSIAWDSRPTEQGGQRWFHLYPNEEIKHDDILHWTKLAGSAPPSAPEVRRSPPRTSDAVSAHR
jgi:hypothetical protein